MKKNGKMVYVPPTVEVIKIALEGVIATSGSLIQHIELEPWRTDDNLNDPQNNADIYVNF